MFTDGGISPGRSYGFVIRDTDGLILHQQGGRLGAELTSNQCEYSALLAGFYKCQEIGVTIVKVLADSQLMIRQMAGQYAVRSENIIDFYTEAMKEARSFQKVTYKHIPREMNTLADELGREAWRDPHDLL